MAFQPPTRPHTANPRVVLSSSFFPARPSSAASNRTKSSVSSTTGKGHGHAHRPSRDHEHEWEDAWDSGSDHEDLDHPGRTQSNTGTHGNGYSSVAIPIRSQSHNRQSSGSDAVAASWASGSYQHVAHRPPLAASKTFTEGTTPPPPGTATSPKIISTSVASGSRLPPGGAWEMVEPLQEEREIEMPVKVGKEAIRENVDDILKDPLQLLSSLCISTSAPATPTTASTNPSSIFPFLPSNEGSSTPPTGSHQVTIAPLPDAAGSSTPRGPSRKDGINRQRSVRTERRREKFAKVLRGREDDGSGVDLGELRRLAWSGVPEEVRPIVWQLLLNYLPLPVQPRLTTLHRKRKEYSQLVDQYFGRGLGALDQQMWHQIEIDVPRTRPGIPLWSTVTAQRSLERILYVWATRHPASGYVQGINDLVTPFFQVFLSAYIDTDPELFDVGDLDPAVLAAIEADSFWCLSKLLDGIQDNYISHQPGIQRLVKRMSELVKRIDSPLAAHFEEQGVEFMQFAFRWMNCLLMREISVKCTVRMWDTYLAEGTDAFSQFHLYVCSALLVKFSERLREMDFQEMIMFLQCLPTQTWTDHDIELLLSEAYVLKTVWQGAENHFANQKPNGGGFGMLGR